MIRNAWSVLCTRCIVDSQTNNITLTEVVEQLNVPAGAQVQGVALAQQMDLVSFWYRANQNQAARGNRSRMATYSAIFHKQVVLENFRPFVGDPENQSVVRSRARGFLEARRDRLSAVRCAASLSFWAETSSRNSSSPLPRSCRPRYRGFFGQGSHQTCFLLWYAAFVADDSLRTYRLITSQQ